MHRIFSALLLIALAATYAPQPDSAQANISAPQTAHAPEIRFALIGAPHDTNAWELFDNTGANYADYALRSEYYPRLYHLAPPELSLQPLAAQTPPAEVIQNGGLYSASIKLRADLKWTDGSRFTAEDAAFTANTAAAFELGFDWRTSYPPDFFDHAEVVDPYTVKFIFKQKPNVGVWQYGVLQSPILQKKFWQARIINAQKLIPGDDMQAKIEKERAHLVTAQYDVDSLTAKIQALNETGQSNRSIEIDLAQRELELGYAKNNLNKALENYQNQLVLAQRALYRLNDKGEPTLGTWVFESKKGNVWVNAANPDFPFARPNFDRAVYTIFDSEKDALVAFKNNKVDFILSQNGISRSITGAKINPTYNARFLVFNPLKVQFADPAFHAALSCIIDRKALAETVLQNKVAPINSFILSSQWRNPKLKDTCMEMNKTERVEYAVKVLKDAGYSWALQPTSKKAGEKLTFKNGETFPKITLSAPSKTADPLRYAAAKYIAAQAQYLGIPFAVREMRVDDIVYEVYSSQKYDAALIGWRLSEYPGYVCEWFGGAKPALINGGRFSPACAALGGESNIESARTSFHQIESELMAELPFIPLFTLTQLEAYQNIAYPSAGMWNGWNSFYGAPSNAMPSP